MVPSGGSEAENVPCLFLAPGGCWQSLAFAGWQVHRSNLCLHLPGTFSSMSPAWPSYKEDLGTTLTGPYFQIRSPSEVLGGCEFWKDTIQPCTAEHVYFHGLLGYSNSCSPLA